MTLLFIDSVDHVRRSSSNTVQALRKWAEFTVPQNVATNEYEGGTAQRGASLGSNLWRATPTFGTQSTLFVHFKKRWLSNMNSASASTQCGVTFVLGGSEQVSFYFQQYDTTASGEYIIAGEYVELVVERNGTEIARHGKFPVRNWHAFQIKCEPGPAGSYEIRAAKRAGRYKEAMQVIATATGVNLADTGLVGADQVRFEQRSGGTSLMMDTIVTNDAGAAPFNDFMDDPRLVRAFYPDSTDATRDDWILRGGSPTKHQALDEPAGSNNLVNDDADRITSDTPGDEQLLGFENLDRVSSAATFDALKMYPEVAMESSGSLTYRVLYENILATLSEGMDLVIGSTVIGMDEQTWLLNPGSSTAWTKSDLDDAKFGIKLIS